MDKLSFPEAGTPQIQVESWSNAARILQVRGFTRDGTLSHDHTTNADRSRAMTPFDVSDIPAMIQVSPTTPPVRRGECYVRVTLLMAGFAVGRLISGYVTDGKTLAWPGGVFENFTDGPGLVRSITGTGPAAGANCSETVPTNARWRLLTIFLGFVTDASVSNRTVQLVLDDGTNTFILLPAGAVQTASLTGYYSIFIAAPYSSAFISANLTMPMPMDVVLFQAWRWRTQTSNLQAGDHFSSPQFMVEEWIEE